MTLLEPIKSNLIKYWTNIFKDSKQDSLWKHEWMKHGTCAAELKALNSELHYFSKGNISVVFNCCFSVFYLLG